MTSSLRQLGLLTMQPGIVNNGTVIIVIVQAIIIYNILMV